MQGDRTGILRWQWILLAVVVLGAAIVRFHNLSNIFLWNDETDFFSDRVFLNPNQHLLGYLVHTRDATTNTWGWPAILWVVCRIFGATLQVARTPGALAGTGMVLAMFFLVHRLLPENFPGNRFVPAIGAAVFAAVAMPQMEFSQRIYPYAAAPLMGAALLIADLYLYRQLQQSSRNIQGLLRAIVCYALVASFVVCIHPSLNVLVALSMIVLAAAIVGQLPNMPTIDRIRILKWSAAAAGLICFFVLLNRKNPKFGFRPYLVQYYHDISLSALPKVFLHAYDLGTYHLNLFYNTKLYWPEQLNIVLFPLIASCVLGWWLSAKGRYGALARHLAILGAMVVTTIAALSFFRLFPFGGVRQTLFLSPFLLTFAVLGIYTLRKSLATRVAGGILVAGYLSLWTVNLPKFYSERVAEYNEAELLRDWATSGHLSVFPWYCDQTVEYLIRDRLDVRILNQPDVLRLKTPPKAPFMLVSTYNALEKDSHTWKPVYEYLQKAGYTATLIDQKQPAHPESVEYSGSIYYPPNGLWVYRVTEANAAPASSPTSVARMLPPSRQF